MAKYRKKPVVIEATRWFTGDKVDGVEIHTGCGYRMCPICGGDSADVSIVYIKTLEGTMYVSEGDWIITGVQGEKYPCRNDIFEKTYELVSP